MKFKVRMVVIALAGVGTSLAAVANFVLTVFHNRLPLNPESREFYLVVGRSYTEQPGRKNPGRRCRAQQSQRHPDD